jgi:hypothetical protein
MQLKRVGRSPQTPRDLEKALRFVVSCVYAVGGAYSQKPWQKPVYTRGGTYTHPLCLRTTARVNAPTRVYAPGCVYAPAA